MFNELYQERIDNVNKILGEINMKNLTLFTMDIFRTAQGRGERLPLPKICHIYPTLMKIGTDISYVIKIHKNI